MAGGALPLMLHKYLYSNADPVNRADPSGRFSSYISLIVTAAIVTNIVATVYNGIRHQKSALGILTDVGINLGVFAFDRRLATRQRGTCDGGKRDTDPRKHLWALFTSASVATDGHD